MKIQRIEQSGVAAWQLAGFIDLNNLMRWQEEVNQYLPAEGALQLSLRDLKFEGSAILSFLVFILRRANAAGGSVTFDDSPARLLKMAEISDLTEILGLR